MGPERNVYWDLQHNWHLQQHPTIYELILLILMTIYDMKCRSEFWIKVKIVNFKSLKWVATNLPEIPCGQQISLRLIFVKGVGGRDDTWSAAFHVFITTAYMLSSVWTVLAHTVHLWKLFRQGNRTRALSINQGTFQTAVIFDSQKLLIATQVSEPRLMVSAIIWKPIKNYGSKKKPTTEWWDP